MDRKPVRFPFAIRAEVVMAIFLFVVTLSLFGAARGFGFIHLDDYPYVADNPMVAGGLRWEAVKQAFTTVHEQWWLPLLWISYMADVDLFGPGSPGHHFVNVLLHAANAALLFWALFRMTGSRWRSAFVAALFAWHPTRVEAVAWIAARKDVLSGLFFMLALLAYVRHARKPSALRMAPVFLLLLAGLMSKAVLVAVPCVLLALDAWPLRRAKTVGGASAWREWRPLLLEKIPLLLLAAVFMAINVHTHTSGMGGDKLVPLATRLGLIAPNVWAYLGKIAAPVRLNILYPECDVVSWPGSIAAALVLAGALALAYRQRAVRPYLLTGGLWFLLLLAPVVRGVRLGLAQYADRWTYLPLIGLGLALVWSAAEWAGAAPVRRRMVFAAGLAILTACLWRTPAQLGWWRDSLTLFARAAFLAPGHPVVHANYGLELLDAGRPLEGEAHLRKAVRLDPGNAVNQSNWGLALLELGRAEEALGAQDRAVALAPGVASHRLNRGIALDRLGRRDEALAEFEEALRLRPDYADAHLSCGNLLLVGGHADEALVHFEAAARARPDRPMYWFNLGLAHAQLGHYAQALACVDRTLRLDPDFPKARWNRMRLQLLAERERGGQ
ncbi:MAG: tetratricopeptide repeat protein [Kiritimatiellia bacterium]